MATDMLSRRGFLRFLGGGVAAAVAAPYVPKKAYSFLGGIFRPRRLSPEFMTLADFAKRIEAQQGWYMNRVAYVKISELLNERNSVLDDVPWLDSSIPADRGPLILSVARSSLNIA